MFAHAHAWGAWAELGKGNNGPRQPEQITASAIANRSINGYLPLLMGNIEPGSRYGMLTVIGPADEPGFTDVRCDCGKLFSTRTGRITSTKRLGGRVISCGCRKRLIEYQSWSSMLDRCRNPKNKKYPRYGGRGIRVCPQWETNFESFLSDMGPRPSIKHTLDRIDNDGNYEPGNCRWSTNREQSLNRSTTKILTYRGESMSIAEWAIKTGIPDHVISRRVGMLGWDADAALTTPVRLNGKKRMAQVLTFNGRTMPLLDWAKETGISPSCIRSRIYYNNWTVERALTTPPLRMKARRPFE